VVFHSRLPFNSFKLFWLQATSQSVFARAFENSNGAKLALQLFHTCGKTYGKVRQDDYTMGN
jgi:hypothetical protein